MSLVLLTGSDPFLSARAITDTVRDWRLADPNWASNRSADHHRMSACGSRRPAGRTCSARAAFW